MPLKSVTTMYIPVPFLLLALALCLATPILAADARELSWSELTPTPVEYDNPFEALPAEQMDGLRRLVRLKTRVEAGDADAISDVATLRAELESSGLDVDGLLARRAEIMELRRAAVAGVNEEVIGETVRIPGFVVPLEFRGLKAVEFLLVPTAGACIHTPPPPANQIVHVRYPEGIEVKTLYDAVWVNGQIAAENSVQAVSYVDGQAPVEASYVMQPTLVEPYR
ncbi:MAG: hypothetical protein RLZ98_3796 [Pseudomonadota bacterium]